MDAEAQLTETLEAEGSSGENPGATDKDGTPAEASAERSDAEGDFAKPAESENAPADQLQQLEDNANAALAETDVESKDAVSTECGAELEAQELATSAMKDEAAAEGSAAEGRVGDGIGEGTDVESKDAVSKEYDAELEAQELATPAVQDEAAAERAAAESEVGNDIVAQELQPPPTAAEPPDGDTVDEKETPHHALEPADVSDPGGDDGVDTEEPPQPSSDSGEAVDAEGPPNALAADSPQKTGNDIDEQLLQGVNQPPQTFGSQEEEAPTAAVSATHHVCSNMKDVPSESPPPDDAGPGPEEVTAAGGESEPSIGQDATRSLAAAANEAEGLDYAKFVSFVRENEDGMYTDEVRAAGLRMCSTATLQCSPADGFRHVQHRDPPVLSC